MLGVGHKRKVAGSCAPYDDLDDMDCNHGRPPWSAAGWLLVSIPEDTTVGMHILFEMGCDNGSPPWSAAEWLSVSILVNTSILTVMGSPGARL